MDNAESIKKKIAKHEESIREYEEAIKAIHAEIKAKYDEEWRCKCHQMVSRTIIEQLRARLENPEGPWPRSVEEMEDELLAELEETLEI